MVAFERAHWEGLAMPSQYSLARPINRSVARHGCSHVGMQCFICAKACLPPLRSNVSTVSDTASPISWLFLQNGPQQHGVVSAGSHVRRAQREAHLLSASCRRCGTTPNKRMVENRQASAIACMAVGYTIPRLLARRLTLTLAVAASLVRSNGSVGVL